MRKPGQGERVYLHWIQKTPMKKQAYLEEPNLHELKDNTPESFYHLELNYRSTLLERAIGHGLIYREPKV